MPGHQQIAQELLPNCLQTGSQFVTEPGMSEANQGFGTLWWPTPPE